MGITTKINKNKRRLNKIYHCQIHLMMKTKFYVFPLLDVTNDQLEHTDSIIKC